MKYGISLLTLALLLAVGCSDSGSSDSADAPENPEELQFAKDIDGFIRIFAIGKHVDLGTNESTAKANEKPLMPVYFTYDFCIGESEVTCGEFKSVMKAEGYKVQVDCKNGNLPVTDVTFYDAVLFANAKSKQEERDTVYSYSKAKFDESGRCTSLEGVKFNTESEGFRLPTESEWALVASQGWDADESWNAKSSDMEIHEVCKKETNKVDVCDMAGNAMEWVNDWLGKNKDTILVNYMGASDGGSLGERIVKGGSFHTNPEAMNYYSRGDVYTVTSSTYADYVGFRLAYGAIPNPVWMNSMGHASGSVLSVIMNSTNIHWFTETYNSKLAFRNDVSGNLAFVDYSTGGTSIVEIMDSLNVYHPDISPDGERVAFCTGMEGVDGKSAVYVRDLNAAGTNLVKLDVESAAIPRWRVVDGDTVIVYVTSAGNNSEESDFQGESTWQVPFAKGKFGTPKKLFDGAYHGGVSADNRLAVTGSRLLRARVADTDETLLDGGRDTVWYAGEQACNVSLDVRSKRTLFLDFGGETGRKFVGKKYDVHERLLVVDSTGALIQSVAAPKGYSFDHSEWMLNGADSIVVASLANMNGSHTRIVLINLADSNVYTLVEGDEIWHPCLWKGANFFDKVESSLDPDSAGVYLHADDEWWIRMIRYKMELLWKYRDSINVAILGSSRPLYGVSPSVFSDDFFAVNFAHTPSSIYDSKDFFAKYLYNNVKNLKYLVVSLDIDFWYKTGKDLGDDFFVNEYVFFAGYVYDKNHNYWQDGYPEGLLEYTQEGLQFEDRAEYMEDRGRWSSTLCSFWGNTAEIEVDSNYYDQHPFVMDSSFNALKTLVKTAAKKDIYVVGAIFPQSPLYRATGAFGRYGLRRSSAEKMITKLEMLSREYPNFVVFDENKMGYHDYTSDMAVDYDHLCGKGATQFTSRLDSLLKTLK